MVQYMDNNSGFAQWNANKNNAQKKSGLGGFMWWFLIFVAAWWTVGLFMTPPPSNTVAPDNTPVVDLSSVPTAEISSNDITATVQGLRISNVKLSKFTVSASDTTPVSLLSADGAFAEFGLIANGTTAPTATTVWKTTDGKFTWRNPDGITFTRTISVDGYDIVVSDEILQIPHPRIQERAFVLIPALEILDESSDYLLRKRYESFLKDLPEQGVSKYSKLLDM